MKASRREIEAYLDDFTAGLTAGPAGSPAFRGAVHRSQERRKAFESSLDTFDRVTAQHAREDRLEEDAEREARR